MIRLFTSEINNEERNDTNIKITLIKLIYYLYLLGIIKMDNSNLLQKYNNELDNYNYLNQIKDSAPSTENAHQYAQLLYDLHIKRSLIGISKTIIQNTTSKDNNLNGKDLIEYAENDLYNLSQIGNYDRKYKLFMVL